MSVRFDATGEGFTATTGIPSNIFTVTWWAYLSADRNQWSTMWETNPNSTTTYCQVGPNATGTDMTISHTSGANMAGLFAMALNTWYCFGVVQTGTAGQLRLYRGTSPSSLTLHTGNPYATTTNTRLFLGYSAFADEWLNGRLSSFKQWSAALTQAEVATELGQFAPARTANLVRRHDFKTVSGTDQSGNGNNLTGGTGATAEADPPGVVEGIDTSSLLSFFI